MTGPPGRLIRIDDLRQHWPREDIDFTPWLARPENLLLLSEAIGLELELEAQERNVGPFRADILCRDTVNDSWVLVENQLERTDHTHLGQLLTYGAGLQTVTIVWIAQRFTEEHRAALDWLNEITNETFRFFGLEIELWRIGDSPAAPKFNVVSQPNDWSKFASTGKTHNDMTETQELQFRYWSGLARALQSKGSAIKPAKAWPSSYVNHSIGRTGFRLAVAMNTQARWIKVEIYITSNDAKAFYKALERQRQEIEAEMHCTLDWRDDPDRQYSAIGSTLPNTDPTREADWPRQHEWLVDTMEKFNSAFRARIREIVTGPHVEDTA